jgi:hypothetical protein
MNFSRNRPETTNLNHQYVIRRVVMAMSSLSGKTPRRKDSAESRRAL